MFERRQTDSIRNVALLFGDSSDDDSDGDDDDSGNDDNTILQLIIATQTATIKHPAQNLIMKHNPTRAQATSRSNNSFT